MESSIRPSGGYECELIQHDSRISGTSQNVGGRQRLVDVLNGEGPSLDIAKAVVDFRNGTEGLRKENLTVLKHSILLAVPRETPEQSRQMLMQRSLVGRAMRRPLTVSILLPGMSIEGTAHLPAGAGSVQLSMLERFFPITEAAVSVAGDVPFKAPVVLVNREAIVAFTLGRPAF